MTGQVVYLPRAKSRPEKMSDEALVAACAVRDSGALGVLFDRFHAPVHRFLARLAGVDSSDAEDLLQETFTQVWRAAPRYEGRSAVLSWIFGIAANVARHHVRKESRRRRALTLLGEQPVPESRNQPDDVAVRSEAMRRAQAALETLSHDRRVAFVMCDLEGISGVDAARALGVRPGTMWRRLHEARKALRSAIDAEGGRR